MICTRRFQILALLLSLISFGADANSWNDISRLNAAKISDVIRVQSQNQIVTTLVNLPDNTKVTISGTRHSQGGHIVYPNGVVLDMTGFDRVLSISPKDKLIVVQSGTTWETIQQEANKHGLAVKVMQSSNIFSVGGSLSANVHGRDPRFGPIIEAVRSIKVALANGDVVTASRTNNEALFNAVIGGYGLLGVILEAEIELTENRELEKETIKVSIEEYVDTIARKADDLSLHYGRCSFVPGDSFLTECYSTNFSSIDASGSVSVLVREDNINRNRLVFAASRENDWGKAARWKLQKKLLDKPGTVIKLDRNIAMQPPVRFLEYDSPRDTDILQEYFVPIDNFPLFFKGLKQELEKYDVNLLSVTLRYLKANDESLLTYATENMIAVVLYINIDLTDQSILEAGEWTRKIVDLSIRNRGTYYLTYQGFPTLEQFEAAYPGWKDFMEVKCKYDPNEVFSSKFYEQYLKAAYKKNSALKNERSCY